MTFKRLMMASAVTSALVLAGCSGDIEINEAEVPPTTSSTSSSTSSTSSTSSSGTANCPSFATEIAAIGSFNNVCEIDQDYTFTSDETLTNDRLWVLQGRTAVGNDNADSATLTIEPGTTIIGRAGDDFLVVRRGSQIDADGTVSAPITMTSFEDVNGDATGIGQWGGLVLLGNAPSNLCDGNGDGNADSTELANCGISAEGAAGQYGGNNPNDNSGTLRYVVVKHAGNALGSGDELNGISLGGVGDATTIDYIQIHENLDDGIEFFGGTVNVKHVVLTGNGDDSFDWSFGWTGKAQYVYVQQNDSQANRGFELDNNDSILDATPLTNPTVSNVTILGSNATDSEGVLLRNGTAGKLHNFVITGPSGMGECLEIQTAETQAQAEAGELVMTHSVVACDNGENFKGTANTTGDTVEAWFLAQAGNSAFTSSSALVLDVNDYEPLAGSPLLGAGLDLSTTDSFFDSTDYIGAFDGTNDWTEGWTVAVNGGFPANIQNAFEQGLATDASADYPEITDKPVYRLQNGVTFTADVTLTNDAHWVLNGRTAVGNDRANSSVLYIQQGTTIIGTAGDDFLVARRGSRIEAVGTAGAPITMTSIEDVTGAATGIGQWGGLVLLGNAPSNLCDSNGDDNSDPTELANCGVNAEGAAGLYGGDDPLDNSGTLKYVIVKHAGNALGSGDELNGITFAGVGSGTTVDYIQVHENLDDGVEFFGGTVNVKHVVLTGNGDDSFDWSFGWTGKAQFVYVQHNGTQANRAFELDNNDTQFAATPLTNPIVSNVTIIGSNAADSEGILLRNGTAGRLHNFVVTGPAGMGECLEIQVAETQAQAEAGALTMDHSVMACDNSENFKGTANTTGDTVEDWFLAQTGNSVSAPAGLDLLADGFTPRNSSPLLGAGIDAADAYSDSFFTPTDYIGAFDGNTNWMDGWAFGINTGIPSNVTAADAQGLATDTSGSYPTITDKPVYTLGTDTTFTQDVVLTNDKHWVLKGRTAVGNDNADSATLYIEPGTILFGEAGDDFLVVRRGSKIEALGSATAPITLTSVEDVTGGVTGIGQWGGLVLLGNAPSNLCDSNGDDNADPTELANCGISAEGAAGLYGGNDPLDNSGTLRYVVVKHAGNALGSGDELNGITFAGVGSGTTVDYIHVHENLDDGVEFFGGTVDVKHVVLTGIGDDSFDWSFGWTGRAQFVLVKQNDTQANRGFELDNNDTQFGAAPLTDPMVANVTIIGSGAADSEGVLLRNGTAGRLHNFIITGPATMGECLEIQVAETQAQAQAGDLIMTNSVVACENGENFKGDAFTGTTVENWFLGQTGNSVEAGISNVVSGYFTATTLAATPADANAIDPWFDTVDFIGAVKDGEDWTAGWVTVGLQ
ncbi:MAG: hypothetical protein V2I33_01925 [Kangiellaceae bacterium]|nr:hypothetical protein [Kangiellaceae bacterium]